VKRLRRTAPKIKIFGDPDYSEYYLQNFRKEMAFANILTASGIKMHFFEKKSPAMLANMVFFL
jgi:hypothetical protein